MLGDLGKIEEIPTINGGIGSSGRGLDSNNMANKGWQTKVWISIERCIHLVSLLG